MRHAKESMREKMIDVLCIGIGCIDILAAGFEKEDFLKTEKETYRINQVKLEIGGDAANEAVILSKLENRVKIICAAGNDTFGDILKERLFENKVDISGIKTYKDANTSVAMVLISKNGERSFVSPRTNLMIPYTLEKKDILPAKVVSLASIGSVPFRNSDSITLAAKTAKQQGSIVCADIICSDWLDSIEKIKEALPYIDFIFPNMEEAQKLIKNKEIEKIWNAFLESGVKNVVIKTGKDGCILKNRKEMYLSEGRKNIPVMDTTGAGDNFAAGFISALIEGKDPKECCDYANLVAAISVTEVGATKGVKSKKQVEEYLGAKLLEEPSTDP